MALWKDQSNVKKEPTQPVTATVTAGLASRVEERERDPIQHPVVDRPGTSRLAQLQDGGEARESLIAREIAVEGKIEGAGHVRIAGRFKGEVQVKGSVSIEQGAKVTGGVRADTVSIGGDVDGNVDSASLVELLDTGVLNGDLKAASLTVAAGSRMRGQVEFGWDDHAAATTSATPVAKSAAKVAGATT